MTVTRLIFEALSRMQFVFKGVLALGVLSTIGCSSTSISLNTVPEQATVRVKPLGSGSAKELGQTPLNVLASDIEKDFGGSGPILVEFHKEGYQKQAVLVTDLAAKNINLKVTLDTLSGLDDPAEMNAQIETLFEAQRLVRVRRYKEAIKLIEQIKTKVPTLSSPHELEAGIFYISRRYREALDAYRKAVKLNPRSVEAVRMRDMLEQTLGQTSARAPAGSGQAAEAPASEDADSTETDDDSSSEGGEG